MIFEPITYADLNEIRDLRPYGWGDIRIDYEFYVRSSYCLPIKTMQNDEIAGIGTLITFEMTSWIGHVIVANKYRRKGIGHQIVLELLKHVEDNSIETCSLIASEEGKPIYLRAGFREVTHYVFMQRKNPWQRKTKSNHVEPLLEKHHSMVFALDRKISGEDRVQLLSAYVTDSFVFVKNNIIHGFYLPALKQGPIIANSEEAGIALMELKYTKADKAVLPAENSSGIRFLERNGFIKTDQKGTRMIYGKDLEWEPKKIYSRIGGNFG